MIHLDAAVPNKLDPVQQQYLEILEKTNQQLSLWWNPYGVMIGLLGVLFAVVAIITAVIIYRQGRDFQSRLRHTANEYRRIIDRFIAEKNTELSVLRERIEKKLGELEPKLEIATGDEQARLKDTVEGLKKQLEVLQPISLPPSDLEFEDFLRRVPSMQCEFCGTKVFLAPPKFPGERRHGECLQCGRRNLQPDNGEWLPELNRDP